MVFRVEPLPAHVDPASIHHVRSPQDSDRFTSGMLVQTWDHLFAWDDSCASASKLASYARLADPPVDDFLNSIDPSSLAGADVLKLLMEEAKKEGEAEGPASTLWADVTRTPPEGIIVDADACTRGQEFFWSNSAAIFAALFHFSLAGGFSSPKITETLHKASYLIPPPSKSCPFEYAPLTKASSERTLQRLYETGQHVLDVMGNPTPVAHDAPASEKAHHSSLFTSGLPNLLPPPSTSIASHSLTGGGEGWASTVRVRLLHGVVRRRIRLKYARQLVEEAEMEGLGEEVVVPLNQEEMAGTLTSFGIAPLWCMERMGLLEVGGKESVREDYLGVWRHVGFYLGIPDSILLDHFPNYLTAGKFQASIVVHLFPSPPEPSTPSSSSSLSSRASACPFPFLSSSASHPTDTPTTVEERRLPPPTMPILNAVSNIPPIYTSLAYHTSLCRYLVGDQLADHLNVPPTGFFGQIKLRLSLFALQYPTWFARVYPSTRWRLLRLHVNQQLLGRMIRMGLGKRTTRFRPREEGSGMLSEIAKAEEEVRLDPVGGQQMMRDYFKVVGEMGVVTALGGMTVGWMVWKVGTAACSAFVR